MKDQILSLLSARHPWRDSVIWFDCIGSTNDQAKLLAMQGAPHGTVLIAGRQTLGRGRLGRSFESPAGAGVYMSVILRPGCKPEELMHLTCATAVAICNAVENAAGFRPGIKWTNDLVWNGKKLGGILTELSVDPATGLIDYAIIGIGINCCQQTQDFSLQLQNIAASLSMAANKTVAPQTLAAAMICALSAMDAVLLKEKSALMYCYCKDCITVDKDVVLVRGDEKRYGHATGIAPDGGLIVRFDNGAVETVQSGEISVRGMYGYV